MTKDITFGKNTLNWGKTNELQFAVKRVPLGTIRVSVEGARFGAEEVTLDFENVRITGVHLKYQASP